MTDRLLKGRFKANDRCAADVLALQALEACREQICEFIILIRPRLRQNMQITKLRMLQRLARVAW